MTRRTPWWVHLIGLSFVSYLALLAYCDIVRPVDYGFHASFDSGRMTLTRVLPDSPAASAGLQVGDVITRAGTISIDAVVDWSTVDGYIQIDRPLPLAVDRHGAPFAISITLPRQPASYWGTGPGIFLLVALFVQAVSLGVAWLIVIKRPGDGVAHLGALVLAAMGVITIALPHRLVAVWLSLPAPINWLFWLPHMSSLAAAAVIFAFFASFPAPLVRPRWLWWPIATPALVAMLAAAAQWYTVLTTPERVLPLTYFGRYAVAISGLYTAGALVAVVVNFRRLTDPNERRKMQVLALGAIVGLFPGFLVFASYWLRSSENLAESVFASGWTTVGVLSALCVPASFTYAILWHRLFDIRVIVRRGVQYALARQGLVSLVPALVVIVLVDVLRHDQISIVNVALTRGWAYAAIVGLVVLAHSRRQQWLTALDRRFFREAYNAQRILMSVAEDVRTADDVDHVAVRLVSHIDAALHPTAVALLVRQPQDVSYRVAGSQPAAWDLSHVRVDSTLVALARVLARPVDLSEGAAGSLRSQLPADEVTAIERSGLALVVPVATGSGHAEGLLLLGGKRSEEPYTQEDRDLLALIAASLEQLLVPGGRGAAGAPAQAFMLCASCGTCYDAGQPACAQDGTSLTPTPGPRTFAARYRIDRRVGQGGLGTVYAARDTALERDVAVKVMRHDLAATADLARRFQVEAKLAASFVHPNVVTVHDFGTSGAQAFLVMEFLVGTTLRAAMAPGPLSPGATSAILRPVCAAVTAAHARQIVHRDLKPENIFLLHGDAAAGVKVLDFGIAKVVSGTGLNTGGGGSDTSPGVLAGTLAYMAPELLRGEEVTPSCDLWALGLIAHELRTGVHPFALHGAAIASASPYGGDSPLTPAERAFFEHALAIDPADRFASAAEFIAAFDAAHG